MARKRLTSAAEAEAWLFEGYDDDGLELQRRFNAMSAQERKTYNRSVLESNVAQLPATPHVLVDPLKVRSDPAVFAQFAGVDVVFRKGASVGEGLVFWGVLRRAQSRIVVGEISIAPLAAWRDRGITADMLRGVSVQLIVAKARARLLDQAEWPNVAKAIGWEMPSAAEIERIKKAAVIAGKPVAKRPGGRPRLSDDFLRGIALEYIELEELGWSRGIRKELAGRRHVSESTVRDWISAARTRGILGKGQHGRAGGGPGPNLTVPKDEA